MKHGNVELVLRDGFKNWIGIYIGSGLAGVDLLRRLLLDYY